MPPDFDPIPEGQLRDLAGAKVYHRGVAYHAEGRVTLVAVKPARVVGHVVGSEVYRAELRRRAGEIEAVCDCPAFDDRGFCKHLVAVALAAAETGAGDRPAALRAHLVDRGAEALADLVLEVLSRDPELRRKLEGDLADANDDDEALADGIRGDIAAATDVDDVVDYWGAATVAEAIDAIRQRLEGLAAKNRLTLASALASELVDGLARVVDAADDSEGEIHAVGSRVIALHAKLCTLTHADPIVLAEQVLDRALAGTTDLFTDAVEDYAEALGETGLAEIRRLAEDAWARLPPPRRDAVDGRRSTLRYLLDSFARAHGDVDARIALRIAELRRPGAYVEIADLCLDAGREAEALHWLEEGLWCFEDKPDERIEEKAAALMARAGRTAEAEALRWRSFERMPTYHGYLRVRDRPDSAAVKQRALDLLRARAARARGPWNADALVLFDVLMLERRFDEAWDCVSRFQIGGPRLATLADASADSHSAEAVAAYEQLAEECIRIGGAPSYDTAVRYVVRRGQVARDPADQARYVAALSARHKAKRTLIPKLTAHGDRAPGD